ncbi:MAG: glycosyltransferase family 4 protein [Synechococcaceae cyanobacterium]
MRLLSLSNCPLELSQGSGYVVLRYSEGLRQRGHGLNLYGPEQFEPLPRLGGRFRSWRLALGMAAWALAALLPWRRPRPQLIECYGAESWLAIALLRLCPGRPRLVIHANGLETHFYGTLIAASRQGLVPHPYGSWHQPNPLRLFAWAFRHADALVTVSHAEARYALAHGYQPPQRLLALPNPLDPLWLDQPCQPSAELLIGYCGSWLPSKGCGLLAEALGPVLRRHPAWRLLLIGVGAAFEPAAWFAPELLPRLEIVPHERDKQRLQALYRRQAIACFPTLFESFGLALAEAMSCGVACLSTATGFAADLRHGEQAWLLPPPPTPAAIAAGLEALIASADLRQRLARGGHEAVQGLRWPPAIDALERFYESLLTPSGPNGDRQRGTSPPSAASATTSSAEQRST